MILIFYTLRCLENKVIFRSKIEELTKAKWRCIFKETGTLVKERPPPLADINPPSKVVSLGRAFYALNLIF